ncbi:aldehyde ferredoxin oxidoreductase N-terminal domain-containing protein [Alkaliphilus hydrothermalis]|uniref:Aldehyde:ferredoxin oxidoreductase n=1 Tax=Alkaliphilus hydrothermalis TaxID=1482730 RepID=A0ABS2NPI1_9FIRM|nr:aldehyde ferredoxin oxidoreductase N-terminal domain-containing protein [Alkaliphilus hydrothermalis]MBM7614853.1 aldehyde:ferredoxin oxidoreductase [Alkaliphilus hydrothermalis]
MGKSPKIMVLDLTDKRTEVIEREDLAPYIGGVGIGVQLLKEYGNPKGEPLSEEQPMIFSKGPMNTIYPVVTKTCSLFKSPLTGELGESYAGARLSMAMGMAGLDGIVIKGKAKGPVALHINNEHVEFKNANPLWGLDTDETTRLLHDDTGRRGLRSILVIGEAGEKEVAYSCVTVDTYRHFGRLGLGAVMGSKKVKAIVVEGDTSQPIPNPKEYRRVYKDIYEKVNNTDLMEKYHGIGTSINVNSLNDLKGLPTRNFQDNHFELANEISGENFAEKHLIKKVACSGCTIGCIHIALLRKKFGESHEYESSALAYDYELIYSLGTMLGVGDPQKLLQLIEMVELIGVDAITMGVLLAWVTEAFDKDIIKEEETLCRPKFGNVDDYCRMMKYIVEQPNDFYRVAAKGTDALAKKYGGRDFAMVLGKNEIAGYHTGYGNILGHTVGARHSHLDNGGYSFDQSMEELDKEKLVNQLLQEEIDRNLLNSLVICLFARKVYDEVTVIDALKAIGYEVTEEQLKSLAKKIFIEKVKLKEEMGYSYADSYFPKRFFDTKASGKKLQMDEMKDLLALYISKIQDLKESSLHTS